MNNQQNIYDGLLTSTKRTPADDLISSIEQFNRSLRNARQAGWEVSVTTKDGGEVSAKIAREV